MSEKECSDDPKETPKNEDANDSRPQGNPVASSVLVFVDYAYYHSQRCHGIKTDALVAPFTFQKLVHIK